MKIKVKVKQYDNQPVFMAMEKLNGYQIRCKVENGKLTVTTKGGEDITESILNVRSLFKQFHGVYDSHFFAELHSPKHDATQVPTLIKRRSEDLQISPFYVLRWNGEDFNGVITPELYERVSAIFPNTPKPEIISNKNKKLKTAGIQTWNEEAIKRKIEGFVFYSLEGEMYKLKPIKTVDAFIHSVEISDSETLKGMIKSIGLGVNEVDGKMIDIGNVSSGLSLEQRALVGQELLGRVVEVSYQDLTRNTKLKMPVFERFRDDEKTMVECSIDQLTSPKYKKVTARKRKQSIDSNSIIITIKIDIENYK